VLNTTDITENEQTIVIPETPIIEKRKPFPHSLGPFGVKQTLFNATSFTIIWDDVKDQGKGGMFTMDKPAFGKNNSLRLLAGPIKDWPVVGQFSPAHPITLSVEEKKAALIPAESASFVWAYPVAITVDVSKLQGIDPSDPDLAFLMVGGYVYFNKEHQVCGVNTIVPADNGLVFSKPKKWNHDLTRYLAKSGRFQPITIKALHDCGARWYCWIRPDEPLIDEGWGTSEKLCPNGGFAYLFHDKFHEGTKEQMEKDCYYHVLNGEEYEEESARIRASIQKYGR